MTELDLGALTAPISRADVKRFRQDARASGVDWARVGSVSLIAIVATCIIGVVAALVIFSAVETVSSLAAGHLTLLPALADPRAITVNRRVEVVVVSTLPPSSRSLIASVAPPGDRL